MTSTFLHCPAPPFAIASQTGESALHPAVVVHVLQTPLSHTDFAPLHCGEHVPPPPPASSWLAPLSAGTALSTRSPPELPSLASCPVVAAASPAPGFHVSPGVSALWPQCAAPSATIAANDRSVRRWAMSMGI